MAKNWAYNYPKRGHTPLEGAPENVAQFGENYYLGTVCSKCFCVVYIPMGEGFEPSKIVTV